MSALTPKVRPRHRAEEQWAKRMRSILCEENPKRSVVSLRIAYEYLYAKPIGPQFHRQHQPLLETAGGGPWFDALVAAHAHDPQADPYRFMVGWLGKPK